MRKHEYVYSNKINQIANMNAFKQTQKLYPPHLLSFEKCFLYMRAQVISKTIKLYRFVGDVYSVRAQA